MKEFSLDAYRPNHDGPYTVGDLLELAEVLSRRGELSSTAIGVMTGDSLSIRSLWRVYVEKEIIE